METSSEISSSSESISVCEEEVLVKPDVLTDPVQPEKGKIDKKGEVIDKK